MPAKYTQTTVLYDSGTVAGGIAIDSGSINTEFITEIGASLLNFAGDATRVLQVTFQDKDGAAISGALSLLSANAATNAIGALSESGPGGASQLALVPPPKVKFTVAAAGTGSVRVVIWGR